MERLYDCGNGYTIVLLTEITENQELVAVLEEIGACEGWVPGSTISEYAPTCCHLAAICDGRIVGGVQVKLGPYCTSFSFGTIWPETVPFVSSTVAHVSVLAVASTDRGPVSPFLPLCGELWRLCGEAGVSEIWHEVTPATLRLYRRMGWPLEIVGEERIHWGEPCYLARMEMSDVARSLRSKAIRSPANARLIAQAGRDTIAEKAPLTAA